MKTSLKLLLLTFFTVMSLAGRAADGGKGKDKVWTRWELSPSADIYYRVEVPVGEYTKSVAVEFLNNYKKEVSFTFAMGDDGSPETTFKPVFNLKKNKKTVVLYPVPTAKTASDTLSTSMKVTLNSIQLGK